MMPHEHTPGWGMAPVLFSIGVVAVSSYAVFMTLAVVVGALLFWRETRLQQKSFGENTIYLPLAALVGGALGAKLPMVILYWRTIVAHFPDLTILLSGRSITGGMIGGVVAVIVVRRKLKITARTGDLFVPAIAAGVAIGRIGCFLRGCCYGTPTTLPWGVNFGDGVARHPTQLYEALFVLVLLALAYIALRRRPNPPGMVFAAFMISYFSFRFLIEFIRVEDVFWHQLTAFQWISGGVVLFYVIDLANLLTIARSQK
jgi:prolipoprotein diacylglyceryl transferase